MALLLFSLSLEQQIKMQNYGKFNLLLHWKGKVTKLHFKFILCWKIKTFKYVGLQSNYPVNSGRNPLFNTEQMKFALEKHLQKHARLHSGDSFDSEQQLYNIARNTESQRKF